MFCLIFFLLDFFKETFKNSNSRLEEKVMTGKVHVDI